MQFTLTLTILQKVYTLLLVKGLILFCNFRCDDQKAVEPVRYCSLAHFVEGNDIARKSFKVSFFFCYIKLAKLAITTGISTQEPKEIRSQEP